MQHVSAGGLKAECSAAESQQASIYTANLDLLKGDGCFFKLENYLLQK